MNPPFARGAARYMIVGVSNTGKTTLTCRIVKHDLNDEEDPTHQLIIFSPNYKRDPQLQKLAQYAAQRGIIVNVFQNFDKAGLEKFVALMEESALKGLRTRCFFDDPVGAGGFTSNVNQKSAFNSFITGIKHYKATIYYSTQAIGSMSKSARKNTDVFVFMPDMTSRKELYEGCRFVATQQDFDHLMDRYAIQPYNALWVNVQFGRKGVYHIDENGHISAITGVPQ